MNLTLNRSSILFIKPLTKLSAFFGLTPFYDFEKRHLVNVKLFRTYSVLLACLISITSTILLYFRFRYIYPAASRNYVIIDMLLEVFSFASLEVSILGASFWNMTAWQRLFQLLHRIEINQNVSVKPRKCSSVFTNANFIFTTGSIVLILFYIYEFYYQISEEHGSYLYLSSIIYFYTEFVQINMISNIALSIKSKYGGIRDILENVIYSSNSESILRDINKVKTLFLTADKIVTTFNNLFGLPILLKLAHMITLTLLSMIIFSTSSVWIIGIVYKRPTGLISINLGYILVASLWSSAIIFSCDAALEEANKLLVTCYKLDMSLPIFSEEKEELRSLENVVKSKPPKFTAAGFFEINRSTLLSLLSTTATYFIVAIQFNSNA